jgi:hypothetical protein
LYLQTAADYSNIQVTKDGYSLINASAVALLNSTEYENQIEAAITFIFIKLNPTGTVAEQISKQLQLLLISAKSGGGASVLCFQQILFDPIKTQASIISYTTFQTAKLATNLQASGVVSVIKSAGSSALKIASPVLAS